MAQVVPVQAALHSPAEPGWFLSAADDWSARVAIAPAGLQDEKARNPAPVSRRRDLPSDLNPGAPVPGRSDGSAEPSAVVMDVSDPARNVYRTLSALD
jgi:hypothetical protein